MSLAERRPELGYACSTVANPLSAPPPKRLGVTHWSTRLLAKTLGVVSDATAAKAWREYRVQPWRAESLRSTNDPELVGKVTDVVGLYLNPPENAIVLCADEKSQIQALDRFRLRPAEHDRPLLPHLVRCFLAW